MSKAADLARQRMNEVERERAPTIDPANGVDLAKNERGVPVPPTDPNNPGAAAMVNGEVVNGTETEPTATPSGDGSVQASTLPEGLTANAVKALHGAGIFTVEAAAALGTAGLDAINGVGDATIEALQAAADAAGHTWAAGAEGGPQE